MVRVTSWKKNYNRGWRELDKRKTDWPGDHCNSPGKRWWRFANKTIGAWLKRWG